MQGIMGKCLLVDKLEPSLVVRAAYGWLYPTKGSGSSRSIAPQAAPTARVLPSTPLMP